MTRRSKGKFLLHSTEISEHMIIEGKLETEASLLIKGSFSGTLHSKSQVTIARSGSTTTSDVVAATITVFGQVGGSLFAAESISVEDRASVSGKLIAPYVRVSEAANFEGKICTTGSGD